MMMTMSCFPSSPSQLHARDSCTLRRGTSPFIVFVLFLVGAVANISEDGKCGIFILVPLSYGGSNTPMPPQRELTSGNITSSSNGSSKASSDRLGQGQGFTHMAAAVMAMRHFNDRDPAVVPELDHAPFRDCPVRFDTESSVFLDSGVFGRTASRSVYQQETDPCAIAGPFDDRAAEDLSIVAMAGSFPLVAHRALNIRTISHEFGSFSSQVYPDLSTSVDALVDFLSYSERKDYIAVLHAATDTGSQIRSLFTEELSDSGVKWRAEPFFSSSPFEKSNETARNAFNLESLQRLKASGFRTIVVAMQQPKTELPILADAAEELGMNNGDYFWIWFGFFDPSLQYYVEGQGGTNNVAKLLFGSAWILPLESFMLQQAEKQDVEDPFLNAWKAENGSTVDRLNQVNPIAKGEHGHYNAPRDYFQTHDPGFGAGLMYDAVMAIGLGACNEAIRTWNATRQSGLSGDDHLKGIRTVAFTGASGWVRFDSEEEEILERLTCGAIQASFSGGRLNSTVAWGVANLFPAPAPMEKEAQCCGTLRITDVLRNGTWKRLLPFVYANNATDAPPPLRTEPNHNFLNPVLRAVGLSVVSVLWFLAVAMAAWVFWYRDHRQIRSAQPVFLYLEAFASMMYSSAIVPLSFDESYGWTATQLSRACMAFPWLLSLGHILMYGALFSKLWRVNRVLQFSRKQVAVRHVVWPFLCLLVAALVVLALWSSLDPLYWDRTEVNQVTGETVGQCHGNRVEAYLVPLFMIAASTTVLTGMMLWKTKDVDMAYSESWWLFTLIVVHVEVILVFIPILKILGDVSVNGRYAGYMTVVLIMAASALFLAIFPRIVAHSRALRGLDDSPRATRGRSGGALVHITGIGIGGGETDRSAGNHARES